MYFDTNRADLAENRRPGAEHEPDEIDEDGDDDDDDGGSSVDEHIADYLRGLPEAVRRAASNAVARKQQGDDDDHAGGGKGEAEDEERHGLRAGSASGAAQNASAVASGLGSTLRARLLAVATEHEAALESRLRALELELVAARRECGDAMDRAREQGRQAADLRERIDAAEAALEAAQESGAERLLRARRRLRRADACLRRQSAAAAALRNRLAACAGGLRIVPATEESIEALRPGAKHQGGANGVTSALWEPLSADGSKEGNRAPERTDLVGLALPMPVSMPGNKEALAGALDEAEEAAARANPNSSGAAHRGDDPAEHDGLYLLRASRSEMAWLLSALAAARASGAAH